MQIIENQVIRNEHSTVPYRWISKGNKAVCIMLPGIGYSTREPLFYYATVMCVNQNIDIIHINYNYAKNDYFKSLAASDKEHWIYEDVKAVVSQVFKERDYDQCFILGKSLGTIPMAVEWSQKQFSNKTIGIWLTPLLKDDAVYNALSNTDFPSLCVIGDQDHHFMEEKVASLEKNSLVSTLVIPNADHSLEIKGDISGTIVAAKIVMSMMEEWIKKTKI
jgi:predicted alpha/beta-hydrolase family hydrolase